MEELDTVDDFLETNRTFLQSVRNGLKSISQEEQQLLLLRNQLGKIKRIREEQLKKDQLIASLKEKVSIYEHERSISLKQNVELQEIMSERISTLEQHLQEKESLEKSYISKIEVLSSFEKELEHVCHLFNEEKRLSSKYKEQCRALEKENQRFKVQIAHDKELFDQMQSLYETLRSELSVRELSAEDYKTKAKTEEIRLQEELVKANFSNEQILLKSLHLEEVVSNQEKVLEANRKTIQALQFELSESQHKFERLQRLNLETENNQLILKKKAESLENVHFSEAVMLKEELNIVRQSNERLSNDLTALRVFLSGISSNMKVLCNLLCSDDESFLRAKDQILGEVHSIVGSFKDDLQNMDEVSQLNQSLRTFILRSLQQKVSASQTVNQTKADLSRFDSISVAFKEVEEKFTKLWQDTSAADTIVSRLLDLLESSEIFTSLKDKSLNLKTTGLSSLLSEQVAKFNSKKRAKVYTQLLIGLENSIETANEFKRISSLPQEVNELREEKETLQLHFQNQVLSLQRAADEAYVAVKISESEADRQCRQLRSDYERKLSEIQNSTQSSIDQLNQQVRSAVDSYEKLSTLFFFFFNQTVALTESYEKIVSSYRTCSKLLKGYQILCNDVKTLYEISIPESELKSSRKRPSFRVVVLLTLAANRLWKLRHRGSEVDVYSGVENIKDRNPKFFDSLDFAIKNFQIIVNTHTKVSAQLNLKKNDPAGNSKYLKTLVFVLTELLQMKSIADRENDLDLYERIFQKSNAFSHHRADLLTLLTYQPNRLLDNSFSFSNQENRQELFAQRELNGLHANLIELISENSGLKKKLQKLKATLELRGEHVSPYSDKKSSSSRNDHVLSRANFSQTKSPSVEHDSLFLYNTHGGSETAGFHRFTPVSHRRYVSKVSVDSGTQRNLDHSDLFASAVSHEKHEIKEVEGNEEFDLMDVYSKIGKITKDWETRLSKKRDGTAK